jgi:hypothetical protein
VFATPDPRLTLDCERVTLYFNTMLASRSDAARKVFCATDLAGYECLSTDPNSNVGAHLQPFADRLDMLSVDRLARRLGARLVSPTVDIDSARRIGSARLSTRKRSVFA